MSGEGKSFWDEVLSGSHHSERKDKVGRYIIHRLNEGANLQEVCGEEYVQSNLSHQEIDEVCCYPEVVEAARERMEDRLGSGDLEPPERRR